MYDETIDAIRACLLRRAKAGQADLLTTSDYKAVINASGLHPFSVTPAQARTAQHEAKAHVYNELAKHRRADRGTT